MHREDKLTIYNPIAKMHSAKFSATKVSALEFIKYNTKPYVKSTESLKPSEIVQFSNWAPTLLVKKRSFENFLTFTQTFYFFKY